VCEALARELGETVTLDVLDGDQIVPIEQASGSTSVMSVNWLGTRSPVHCTASGKVILAFAPPAARSALVGRPLERRTPRTITDAGELEAQLREVREDGYARTFEELEVGLNAVAAPVRSAGGEVIAGLDVSGPAHRIAASEGSALVARTREAADDLSHRLGYRGLKRRPSA
jgi:DNA-binding IclR family transcriptional regulator